MTMKVLLVSSYRKKGGAARAASRLQESLSCAGVLVEFISIYDEDGGLAERLRRLCRALYERLAAIFVVRKVVLFSSNSISNRSLVGRINRSDADVVHLHWFNAGGMSVADIASITKPVVWTLHDMWGFTGGCHYDAGCGRYKVGCGSCPQLYSSKGRDLSWRNLVSKKKALSSVGGLTVVGVSRWLADCADQSVALSGTRVVSLPNPLDTSFFTPVDNVVARNMLKLPQGKKLILFGAVAALEDSRKGFEELVSALVLMPRDEQFELVVFGGNRPKVAPDFGFVAHYVGHINDDEKLKLLYSAVDVMVVPSLQEAFGQTATEAMSCGTPVVAFGSTGLLDIIDHQVNGYLAEPYYPSSLAEGIEWVLGHPNYEELSMNARKKVETSFDYKVVAEKYKRLYEECLAHSAVS